MIRFWESILKRVHHDHFCVQVTSKSRVKCSVPASLNDFALRVDQNGADTIVSRPRRR
jgi:hypothetical protein